MAFGSARRTHFNEAFKSLKLAESAIKQFEDPQWTQPKDPLPGNCEFIYHRLSTINYYLIRAGCDLARSGNIAKMPPPDRQEFIILKDTLAALQQRMRRIEHIFRKTCLSYEPRQDLW